MSVRIRLAKTGKTHQVSYRIVAQDAKSKRDGRFLEILGYFQPYIKSSANLKIDMQKINSWLAKGAKPTDAVARLLDTQIAKRLTTNADKRSTQKR